MTNLQTNEKNIKKMNKEEVITILQEIVSSNQLIELQYWTDCDIYVNIQGKLCYDQVDGQFSVQTDATGDSAVYFFLKSIVKIHYEEYPKRICLQ